MTSDSRDLISLAEKGRIGKNGSSEGSCSSEAGSGDVEDGRSSASGAKAKTGPKRGSRSAKQTSNVSNPISFVDEIKSQFNTAFESDAQSSTSQDFSQHLSQSETHSIPKCGSLEVSFAYDAPTKKLMVTVFEANDIPCKERGGANQIHVRLVLLPHKRHKHKTKIKPNGNTIFNETFTISRISPEEVLNLGLRFRVYGTAFARREQMIGEWCPGSDHYPNRTVRIVWPTGESVVLFAICKPQQQETRLWLTLEPRSNLTVSISGDWLNELIERPIAVG